MDPLRERSEFEPAPAGRRPNEIDGSACGDFEDNAFHERRMRCLQGSDIRPNRVRPREDPTNEVQYRPS